MNANWRLATGLLALLTVSMALAAPLPAPLTVLCNGASRASVYVAPLADLVSNEVGGGEVGKNAFWPRYYRGATPVTLALPPGDYLVSVMPSAEYDLHDAMQRAREVVWDGYDHHAVVYQTNNSRWRYAHCYQITKTAEAPLTVFAAFAPPPAPDECAILAPAGGAGTKFEAGEEEALKQLEEGGVGVSVQDDLLEALLAGNKVLLQSGISRWAIAVAAPNRLQVQEGRSTTNWSGHRLTVLAGE